MLRGFRWQVAALIVSGVLFGISLALRGGDSGRTADVTAVPTSTNTPAVVVTDSAAVVQAVTATPEQPAVSALPVGRFAAADNVPTFREGLVGSIQRLNPLFASLNPVDADITSLIFEGLIRTNEYGEPRPALAERWVISSDGLEYTFFLRRDVLWQDGIPFSAADVLYTTSILRAPDFPGDEELGSFWQTVETEQLDPFIVRFRLTQPLATFLDKVSIGILPEHALRGTSAAALASHPFNLTPIGTGAYQLEAIRANTNGRIEMVDLRVAPVYRQRPEGQAQPFAIDRVRFVLFDNFNDASAAVSNGEIDALAGRDRRDRQALFLAANTADLATWNTLEPTLGVLIFNWTNQDARFLRDQRVRVALETGLDRAAMIERALGFSAVMATSPILPGSWAYSPNLPYPNFDTASARALLQTASDRFERQQETNEGDEPAAEATAEAAESAPTVDPNALFTFSLLTPDDPALINLANEIVSQWAQLGVSVSVETADIATYQARLEAHDFDTALVEYSMRGSADPDVFSFWHQGEYPDGENYGGADDRTISELLELARRDAYGINRIEHYHEFQRTFVERAIAIPLYYPVYTYVTSPRLDGISLGYIGTPADRFRSIGAWSLQ